MNQNYNFMSQACFGSDPSNQNYFLCNRCTAKCYNGAEKPMSH